MSFKRMTPQQRETYRALRTMGGVMVVTPQVSRQLRALQSRGLVRYGREYGARVAVLKRNGRRSRTMRRIDNLYEVLFGGQ